MKEENVTKKKGAAAGLESIWSRGDLAAVGARIHDGVVVAPGVGQAESPPVGPVGDE